jgi:bifunctional UDP-N-acetylglucosamine pyrophosphorylase/glucosamine-1-phosphate N-acetyltransferase
MRSDLPKVLQPLGGRPMIRYIVEVLTSLGFGESAPKPVYVVGYRSGDVIEEIGDAGAYAIQVQQLGTGDAARVALDELSPSVNRVLVVHGDEPLIGADSFREMFTRHSRTCAPIVLLTGEVAEAHNLGRVVRDESGQVSGLVQQGELSESQARIREINFGAYVFDREFMENAFPRMRTHAGGEYYLTDLVRFAVEAGRAVETVSIPHPDEQMGINDADELTRAEAFLRNSQSQTQ